MTMTSKFGGRCKACGNSIKIGELIEWTRETGARHKIAAQCLTAGERAVTVAQAAGDAPKIDAAMVVAFLAMARERGLKRPAVRFLDHEQHELRLSLAKEGGKNPGAVYVKRYGAYIGKIAADGTVDSMISEAHRAVLTAIAADPAKAAKAYAALMGRCSFCALQLTDAGSVEVGYGPICAKHYGLPHTALGSNAVQQIEAA